MRILFVTARPPWPGRRGDQIRVGGLARELARRHQVHILCQQEAGAGEIPAAGAPSPAERAAGRGNLTVEAVPVGRGRRLLGLAGAFRRPLQVALHHHRAFRRATRRAVAELAPDVVVLVLSRVGDVVKALGGVPVVVDLIDALELNMERRGERQPRWRPLLAWEGRRMARWDRRLVGRCQLATVVAERDRRVVVGDDEDLASKVRLVPLGIPCGPREPLAVARRPVVASTGNLGYFPTVDGIRWFAAEVWPRIRRQEPRAEWWLAGARPAAAIRRLATEPGVRLFAEPEDLGSILRQAAVAVAPLWAGSGTPIKILEAMAASVPVVTTGSGRAGLDDLPAEAILATDRPRSFADAVLHLLAEPDLACRQIRVARQWLLQRHDLRVVGERFATLLEEAIARFETAARARTLHPG